MDGCRCDDDDDDDDDLVQSAQSVSWVVQEVQCSYDEDLDGREAGSLT